MPFPAPEFPILVRSRRYFAAASSFLLYQIQSKILLRTRRYYEIIVSDIMFSKERSPRRSREPQEHGLNLLGSTEELEALYWDNRRGTFIDMAMEAGYPIDARFAIELNGQMLKEKESYRIVGQTPPRIPDHHSHTRAERSELTIEQKASLMTAYGFEGLPTPPQLAADPQRTAYHVASIDRIDRIADIARRECQEHNLTDSADGSALMRSLLQQHPMPRYSR